MKLYRDDFGFPIHFYVQFSWSDVDAPRYHSYGFFHSWLDFLGVIPTVFNFHSSHFYNVDTVLQLSQDTKLECSLCPSVNCCQYLVQYHFNNMYQKESLTLSSTVISFTLK